MEYEYTKDQILTYATNLINKRLEVCRKQIPLNRDKISELNRTLAVLPKRKWIQRMNIRGTIQTGEILLRTFKDLDLFYTELLFDMENGDACNFVSIIEEEIEKERQAYKNSFEYKPGGVSCKPQHIIFRKFLEGKLGSMKKLFHTDKKLCPKHSKPQLDRDYTLTTEMSGGFGRWMDADEA